MGSVVRVSLLLVAVTLGAERPARAEGEPSVRQFVGGAAQRARRAIAIGPTVGGGGAYQLSPGEADAPITFGLAFRLFDIPVVPGPKDIQEMITARARSRTAERVKAMVLAGQPPPDEAEIARIGVEVLEEVKAEILGQVARPARTLEKPRLAITLEGARLLRAEAWQLRGTVGIGVSKVTIGPTITGHLGDADGLLLGGELGLHLTPWKGVRSPVVDVYLRGELGVTDAVSEADLITLGARFLLDLI